MTTPRLVPESLRKDSAAPADDPLLTAAQVGRMLGVRPKRVYELGLPYVRISERCLRWRRSDVQAWIDARRHAA